MLTVYQAGDGKEHKAMRTRLHMAQEVYVRW